MTKTIGCVECGESVPYGRLSCPACGALLASVTRPRRAAARAADADADAPPATADAPPATAVEPLAATAVEPLAATAVEPIVPAVADPVATESPTPWAPMVEPEPILVARPYRPSIFSGADEPTYAASPPSAHRPPTLAMSAATAGGPSWPAVSPAPVVTARAMAGEPATAERDVARPGVVDLERLAEIAGWFVVVGASMSILGFLLPWSVTVIGARSFGGYFGSWGLASPTHLLVLLGLLAVLALGVLRTPVPEWLRTGVLGLGLGGLLIGLIWPYVVGPLGADVGVLVTALGGLSLVIGGAVASWATRHEEADPLV